MRPSLSLRLPRRIAQRVLTTILLATLAFGPLGCAARLQSALVGSLIEDVSAATARHDDLDLVASGVPTFLLLLEGLLVANPQDPQLLLSASEIYTSYATLVEVSDPQRAKHLYHRGKVNGLKALALRLSQPDLLRAPYAEFVRVTDDLAADDLPVVFWAAASWGAWISANTESIAALAELPKVIKLMQWIVAQDETFQYGSPHVFLGSYYAALPPMLGGDPEKAAEHFDRAIAISKGQALMVYVAKAKFYARITFDRGLYESLLNQALTQSADAVPELTLQNIAAQRQAQTLLDQADDFF